LNSDESTNSIFYIQYIILYSFLDWLSWHFRLNNTFLRLNNLLWTLNCRFLSSLRFCSRRNSLIISLTYLRLINWIAATSEILFYFLILLLLNLIQRSSSILLLIHLWVQTLLIYARTLLLLNLMLRHPRYRFLIWLLSFLLSINILLWMLRLSWIRNLTLWLISTLYWPIP